MHVVLQVRVVQLATHVSLVALQVAAQLLAVPMHAAPQPASEDASGAAAASSVLGASALGASAIGASGAPVAPESTELAVSSAMGPPTAASDGSVF